MRDRLYTQEGRLYAPSERAGSPGNQSATTHTLRPEAITRVALIVPTRT
jgi:hypothetical protein